MNKSELVDAIAQKVDGITKVDIASVVDATMAAVKEALTQDESVMLIGFGTFSVGQRQAREGRNPATGETIQIAAAKTIKFTAGKAFKDAVNPPPVKEVKKAKKK
jgi:DNA-binding protein HU-beta